MRARDTRLGREVAVKVLAASASTDAAALQRFQQEAQAASALNHPNIITVHDIGREDDHAFIVTELLEGETLRDAIRRGHLTPAAALEYGAQVATGLAAAHRKGILHRDIKPENLLITPTGTLKILDFGISKLVATDGEPAPWRTNTGAVLGTPAYMSPEQIRQQGLDARTDIFSLGVVLYEALAGRAPFQGESAPETAAAVLTSEPPPLSRVRPGLTAAIDEVVRACLAKNPSLRFESAADLARTLQAVSPLADERSDRSRRHRRRVLVGSATVAIVALLMAIVPVVISGLTPAAEPSYRRITFARGTITSARFRPGSSEVIYDAAVNGEPREVFTTVPGASEARSLGIRDAEVLAVSRSGDVALALKRRIVRGYVGVGTLAVVSEGRAPRLLLENVHWADWAPDGKSLAIVREIGGRTRLEFPIGTVLFETGGWISDARFSPAGTEIAFVEHPLTASASGRVMVTTTTGRPRALTRSWFSILGMAWGASGREVWFTAEDGDGIRALRAVDPQGRTRLVTNAPARLRLMDISRDGRVLLRRDDLRLEVHGAAPGDPRERDLSWLDWSLGRDMSRDGTRLLITEYGEAAAAAPGIYMRSMDGSPAVRLGTGSGLALSPDGQRVLALWNDRLSLLPVGAGTALGLPHHGVSYHPTAGFSPDGRRVIFTGNEPGRATRVYAQEIPDGRPIAITPEGFRLSSPQAISPDGRTVVVAGDNESLFLCSMSGGEPRLFAGALPGEVVAGWARDGAAVYVFEPAQVPALVYRLSVGGARELANVLVPQDRIGALAIHRLVMTPGGEAYAYTMERHLADLYVATGFEEPPLLSRLLQLTTPLLTRR